VLNAEKAQPNSAAAWAERAETLRRGKNQQEALKAAMQALKLDPTLASMWECIGFLLLERGRWKEAQDYLKQAVSLEPQNVIMRTHYAVALMEGGALDKAHNEIQYALRSEVSSGDAHFIMGEILCRAGYYDLATAHYSAARQAGLGSPAIFGQGTASFLTGQYAKGLELLAAAAPAKADVDLPDWKGQKDPALHLVICGAYGFGDLIHFLRYVPEAQKRVGKITLLLPQNLIALIAANLPSVSFIPHDDAAQNVLPPDAHMRCFYMDLPHLLGPPFDPLTSSVPYINADADQTNSWREKLAVLPRPRIGLVWAGNPLHQNDHNRSVPFEALTPLIDLAKPHLVSLQRDTQQPKAAASGLFDAVPLINDFADSAACMASLDLLVTIDSAPAHLAGAMGLPVWVLLPFNPDWRWLLGREDCIWYPSMRLFRQRQPKDWGSVVDSLCIELQKFLAGDKTILLPKAFSGDILRRHPQALSLPGVS